MLHVRENRMTDAHRTPLNQTAFVTTDMETAVDFWTDVPDRS